MTSDIEARTRGDEGDLPPDTVDEPTGAPGADVPAEARTDADRTTDDPAGGDATTGTTAGGDAATGDRDAGRTGGRLLRPLALALAVLLVLLAGATAYLWFTRPDDSPVSTGTYAEALQSARSAVVDFTSFDYLTLDDDIEQVRRVTTGDLRDETVALLESKRDAITQTETVVNTEIVGAGATSADSDSATVLLVVESTRQSTASPQAEVKRWRIEVTMEKSDGRWMMSGLTGTDTPIDD